MSRRISLTNFGLGPQFQSFIRWACTPSQIDGWIAECRIRRLAVAFGRRGPSGPKLTYYRWRGVQMASSKCKSRTAVDCTGLAPSQLPRLAAAAAAGNVIRRASKHRWSNWRKCNYTCNDRRHVIYGSRKQGTLIHRRPDWGTARGDNNPLPKVKYPTFHPPFPYPYSFDFSCIR